VSAGWVGEDAVSDVLMSSAAEEIVGNDLSPLATLAARASDVRHSSVEGQVVEPDIFSARLHY
jgi:hypothetical protein